MVGEPRPPSERVPRPGSVERMAMAVPVDADGDGGGG